MKKQILIEKYIKPSEIIFRGYGIISEYWFNRNYYLHSFMGQPAENWYYNGKIKSQNFYKKGAWYRERNLPTYIRYDDNEQTIHQGWYKNGVFVNYQLAED
jgi:hypothetical protein